MLFYNDVCSEILSRWLIDEIACFFEPECHFRSIKLAEDFHIIVAILKVKASVLNALLTVRLYFGDVSHVQHHTSVELTMCFTLSSHCGHIMPLMLSLSVIYTRVSNNVGIIGTLTSLSAGAGVTCCCQPTVTLRSAFIQLSMSSSLS